MILLLLALLHLAFLFTPLTVVTGWLIFFLPGALLLNGPYAENSRKLDWWRKSALALFLSITAISLASTFGSLVSSNGLTQSGARLGYAVILFILTALYVFSRWRRGEGFALKGLIDFQAIRTAPRWPIWTLLVGLMLIVGHMLLYRFLPEADGYGWGAVLRTIEETGSLPQSVSRVQFVSFAQTTLGVLHISLFALFKVVLPLLVWVAAWLVGCGLVAQAKLPEWLKSVWAGMFLGVPVLMVELVVGRPQSIAIISYLIVLFVLSALPKVKTVDLFVLLGIGVGLAFRMHELVSLLLPVTIVVALSAWWPLITKNPKRSALYIGGFALLALVAIWPTSIGDYIRTTWVIFTLSLARHDYRLWFINNYVNTDGIELGWPGWQAALYYAYNIGFALPAAAVLAWWSRSKQRSPLPMAIALAVVIFLSFAELFPRIGYSQLPDRAWIFLSLALVLVLQVNAERLGTELLRRGRVWTSLFLLAIVGSLVAGYYVTYAKQGRVTNKEYEAVTFIQDSIPEGALIISQSLNEPLVRFFAGHGMTKLPAYFTAPTTEGRQSVIYAFRDEYNGKSAQTLSSNAGVYQDQALAALAVPISTTQDLDLTAARINEYLQRMRLSLIAREELGKPTEDFYILYSRDKLKGLTATRAWWREEAFPDFPVEEIAKEPYAELVYTNGTVYIWKVK
ncbi:MAG TPA: hypothetical protein VLA04_04550 [Verrucomicrobiae bacterium]|nr:hypothetical protein [Verrucomicrobiae bacterium]